MSLKTNGGRLREAGIRQILEDRAAGCTYQEIAERMGCSLGTVYNVVKGKVHAEAVAAVKAKK